jgi:hypothetical protein
VFDVPVPPLWASNTAFKKQWKTIKESITIHSTSLTTSSHEWSVDDCIRWIYSHSYYAKFIKDHGDVVLIIRGDGIAVGGRHASFLIATLLNFGVLSKSPSFNFYINIAEVKLNNSLLLCSSF